MAATQTQAITTTIPLNKLIGSADNVRRTGGGIGIDELAASIRAHGVLQNMIVRFPEDEAKGRYEVIAGGRRLAALHMLAKSKKIAETFPVPCVVRAPDEATELSLAKNTKRLAMHPADEFAAYRAWVGIKALKRLKAAAQRRPLPCPLGRPARGTLESMPKRRKSRPR